MYPSFCFSFTFIPKFRIFLNSIKADGTAVKYESEVRTVEAMKKFVEETLA